MRPSLLMSFFTDVRVEDLAPFSASFLRHVPDTDLVPFTFTQNESVRSLSASRNIRQIDARTSSTRARITTSLGLPVRPTATSTLRTGCFRPSV